MHPGPDSTIFVKFFSPLRREFVGVSKITSERVNPANLVPQQIRHETKWVIPREEVYALMEWLKDPLSDLDGLARLINARYDAKWTGAEIQKMIDEDYGGNGHKAMKELFPGYDKKRGFYRDVLHRQIDEDEWADWISLWELGIVEHREKQGLET